MTFQTKLLFGILGLLCGALAFAAYSWIQRRRISRIEVWIKAFLFDRFGELPANLRIQCTNDQLWPILVAFDDRTPGIHHRMQFMCSGPQTNFRLSSEIVDKRSNP